MTVSTIAYERATLPVLAKTDAVVIGGSLAGVAAALGLARAGRQVMLVEPRTYLGREITATLRPWLPDGDAHTLVSHLAEAAGVRLPDTTWRLNLDSVKQWLEDALLAANVRLLYASLVVGVQVRDGALHGVVVGNKSGRQFIECGLLLDTSETALVARLLREPFNEPPVVPVRYRRTLEFDGVAQSVVQTGPLSVAGQTVRLWTGYREKGHLLVECDVELPYGADDGFGQATRETAARHHTMALAAALTNSVPGFESAYLSGASYELHGPQSPPLAERPSPGWAAFLTDTPLMAGLGGNVPVARFAGSARGIWYLHEAIPGLPEWTPDVAARLGAALGKRFAERWSAASVPAAVTDAPALPERVTQRAMLARELDSPQRGRPYPRVAVVSDDVPVLREIDVLVVGGGSSGATAGITAAREGMRTVLTEMNPGLGGTGTFGGVHSYWFGRRVGFAAHVMQIVDDMHGYLHHPLPKGVIPKWNIEAKAYALLKDADEAGVEALFNTFVIAAVADGGTVRGSVVATRYGPVALLARVVIDATGDGDVAAFAGAETVYGNERDHIVMWYALAQFTRPGLTRNHFTSMVDVSNTEDYTRAILAGRRRGGKGEIHDHGIYIAPRESRHIVGDVVLTLNDQLRRHCWPDVVNIAFSNHDVKGHSGSDWLRIGLIPPNLEIEIPFRALLPRSLDNILVVGKAISATHDALPAIRMQADLENLGGVAALAAAHAVREGVSVRSVDVRGLQRRLVAVGVLPPHFPDRSLRPLRYTDDELRALVDAIPSDVALYVYSDMELTDIYQEVIPFVEVCCAGPQALPILEAALERVSGQRRILLAQALALVGGPAAVPILVDAIEPQLQGDLLPSRTAHIRYTQLPPDHGAMPDVVYLLYSLGMVADERALPVWARVVDLLRQVSEEDFYDDMKGVFYYVDAVCFGAERLAIAGVRRVLRALHQIALFRGRSVRDGFQADYVTERIAYLELVIGRALARCGDADGLVTLITYLADNRALLAEHAHTELVAITGADLGKNVQAWSQWLEANGEGVRPVPWRPDTDAMQAWHAEVLVPRTTAVPVSSSNQRGDHI